MATQPLIAVSPHKNKKEKEEKKKKLRKKTKATQTPLAYREAAAFFKILAAETNHLIFTSLIKAINQ